LKCKTCYFYHDEKCILHKQTIMPIFCSTYIKKIYGIDSTEKYIDIVYGRKQNLRVFAISIISLLISLSVLILKIIDT